MFSGLEREEEEEEEEEEDEEDGVREEDEAMLEGSGVLPVLASAATETWKRPSLTTLVEGEAASLLPGMVSGLRALPSWPSRLPTGCWDWFGPGNGGSCSEVGVPACSEPTGYTCALVA